MGRRRGLQRALAALAVATALCAALAPLAAAKEVQQDGSDPLVSAEPRPRLPACPRRPAAAWLLPPAGAAVPAAPQPCCPQHALL